MLIVYHFCKVNFLSFSDDHSVYIWKYVLSRCLLVNKKYSVYIPFFCYSKKGKIIGSELHFFPPPTLPLKVKDMYFYFHKLSHFNSNLKKNYKTFTSENRNRFDELLFKRSFLLFLELNWGNFKVIWEWPRKCTRRKLSIYPSRIWRRWTTTKRCTRS